MGFRKRDSNGKQIFPINVTPFFNRGLIFFGEKMYSLLFHIFIPFSVLACHINKITVYWLTDDVDLGNDVAPMIDNDVIAGQFLSNLKEKNTLSEYFIDENEFVKFMKSLHQTIKDSLMFEEMPIERTRRR